VTDSTDIPLATNRQHHGVNLATKAADTQLNQVQLNQTESHLQRCCTGTPTCLAQNACTHLSYCM